MKIGWLVGVVCLVLCAPAEAKPTVLLVHGGGFYSGSPSDMNPAAREARERGFRPVKVRYAMRDIPQALEDVREAAERTDARYAFGNSAGGTLVGTLAREGVLDAVVLNSAPVDLPTWFASQPTGYQFAGRPSEDVMADASPALHGTQAKVLYLGSDDDPVVSPAPAKAWAKRSPRVAYRSVLGGHEWSNPNTYRIGMRFLAKQRDSRDHR